MNRIREIFKTGESGKIWLRTSLVVAVLAALTFGVLTLVSSGRQAAAHQDPAGCNGDGLAQAVSQFPSGTVNHGDKLTYSVTYSIGTVASGACNITGLNAFVELPDGTSIQTLTNRTFNAGDPSITCPGDAACSTAGPYSYVVDHADEAGTPPGVTASFDYDGVLHDSVGDANRSQDHKALTKQVKHPDVQVTKTAKDEKVFAGDPVTFNILVEALGTFADLDTAPGVTLNDPLPDGDKTWQLGGADQADCSITAGKLDCSFGDLAPGDERSVSVSTTATAAQCDTTKVNTATVSLTGDKADVNLENNSSTASVRINCVTENPPIRKCVSDNLAFCIEFGNPHLANLWLCNTHAVTCDNKEHGVEGVNFNLNLKGPVRGLDPKCTGFPNFQDPGTCARQTIGAFEFELRYDSKYVTVSIEPGSLWFAGAGGAGGGPQLDPRVTCSQIRTQNAIQFRCNVKGKELVITGPGTLAVVHVRPTADDYSFLIPSQLNGITTQLINQDCNLADLQGHPIKIAGQTEPGVGPAVCDDADVTIRYLEGDVHADCVIDVRDQQQIAFRWGSHLGQLLYNSNFDLEPSSPKLGDGDIDAKDLQMVFGRHESSCKAPHPAQDPVDPKAKVDPQPPA